MNQKLNKLITDISRSIGQRKLYFADHPIIKNYCSQIVDDLEPLLDELGVESLFIGVVEGKLVYDGHFLVGPSIMAQQLVAFAGKLRCGGLILGKETTAREVRVLLDLAGELQSSVDSLREGRRILKEKDVINIELASPYFEPSSLTPEDEQMAWDGKTSGTQLLSPLMVYQALFDVVATAHGSVNLDRSVDVIGAQSVSEHLLNSIRSNFTDMLQFVHYPDYDSYTVGHSVRVATLAVFVGGHLGLSDEQLLDLGTAGLLHDIGKSRVPSEILFKQGDLTVEEVAIMRSHPGIAAEILLEQRDATQLQVAAAWGHHIRHDGGGYPEPPPWATRSHFVELIQICDVFEALTAVRPYKPGLSPLEAFGIMVQDKGAFEPAMLNAFITSLGIYPPGNSVKLTDGSQGVVVAAGALIDKPSVRITRDRTGAPVDAKKQRIIDLEKDHGGRLAVDKLISEEFEPQTE